MSHKNVSKFFVQSHRQHSWFTLVELIVVITILTILSTIAFLSYSTYNSSARDSSRLSDMNNIALAMESYLSRGGMTPMPASPITLTASGVGNVIGYQGYADSRVLSMLSVSDAKDPLDKVPYTYSVSASLNKYQILWFLENSDSLSMLPIEGNSLVSQAYADPSTYAGRTIATKWSSLWILLASGTLVPAQVAGQNIDVVTTNSWYVAAFWNTSTDQITGTWWTLKKLDATFTLASQNKASTNLSDIKNGSLIGYWDMSTDAADGRLKDLSGNANDGTYMNGAGASSVGKLGAARSFDGVNDYIQFGTSAVLQPANLTITAWAKTTDTKQIEFIAGFWDTGAQWYWLATNNFWMVYFKVWSAAAQYQMPSSTYINDGQYHFVAGTYDGITQRVYVDGVEKNHAGTVTGPITYTWMTNGFLVGITQGFTSTRFWNGSIDEVRVYNRALSSSEIQTLYNLTK